MIGPVGQIAVKVGSLAEAREFYGSKLGLNELFVAPNVAGYDVGGVRLLLIEHEGFTGAGTGAVTIYLSVGNIESEHNELVGRGAKNAGEPHCVAAMNGTETWIGFVEDPSGNLIGLIEDRRPKV